MNKERKHIIFLARWYPHRYDPMFGLFVQRHAEAAALFNDITVIYCNEQRAQCPQLKAHSSKPTAQSKFEIVGRTKIMSIRFVFIIKNQKTKSYL